MELSSLALKIARSENLPVLSQVANNVLKLADSPDASPRAMEQIIVRDPAISAKILKVANSSYYGLNGVETISRAVATLGMNTIRSLVIGIAYQQMLAGKENAAHYSKVEFWRHSLAVAVASKIIAMIKMPAKAEELYSVGMMHDVGYLVMDRFLPSELNLIVQTARAKRCAVIDVEADLLGFDHTDVGALLAEKWGFSGVMLAGIKHHHSLIEDLEHTETTAVIALADGIAHQAGFTNNSPDVPRQLDRFAVQTLGIPEEQLKIISEVVAKEVEKAQEAFRIG